MNRHDQQFECERCVDAAAYVLGALADAESYRDHLDSCTSCQAEVARLQPVVDTLPASVPPQIASEALRQRILATVRSEAELLRAAGHEADLPPRPPSRRHFSRANLARVAVAVAVGAAVAVAIALSAGSSTRERVSTGEVAASIPGARATLRQLGGRADLVVSGMPRPESGKIYEVWLLRSRGGSPQPTDALFGVTSRGSGSASVPSIRGIKEVLVTSEPLGGSARPTSAPLIRVALRS